MLRRNLFHTHTYTHISFLSSLNCPRRPLYVSFPLVAQSKDYLCFICDLCVCVSYCRMLCVSIQSNQTKRNEMKSNPNSIKYILHADVVIWFYWSDCHSDWQKCEFIWCKQMRDKSRRDFIPTNEKPVLAPTNSFTVQTYTAAERERKAKTTKMPNAKRSHIVVLVAIAKVIHSYISSVFVHKNVNNQYWCYRSRTPFLSAHTWAHGVCIPSNNWKTKWLF